MTLLSLKTLSSNHIIYRDSLSLQNPNYVLSISSIAHHKLSLDVAVLGSHSHKTHNKDFLSFCSFLFLFCFVNIMMNNENQGYLNTCWFSSVNINSKLVKL